MSRLTTKQRRARKRGSYPRWEKWDGRPVLVLGTAIVRARRVYYDPAALHLDQIPSILFGEA